MSYSVVGAKSLRSGLLLSAASAAIATMTVPAAAQQAACPPGTTCPSVETVVVTGSRIPQQGLYSTSPVTAIGQQEMKFEGTTDVSTLLDQLPSVTASFSNVSSAFNGTLGVSNVNLRDLGPSRTLVLVDGKRLMPGDPVLPFPDINQIPAALVDHVEVDTGGASAVYGSDAIAGVVNFIMKKDFEGIEVDGQYSLNNAPNDGHISGGNASYAQLDSAIGAKPATSDWWGGENENVTLIMGVNSDNDKGNITGWVGYLHESPVQGSSRDFSNCTLSSGFTNALGCVGSSNFNRWISFDNLASGISGPFDFFQTGTGKPGSGAFTDYTGDPTQKYNFGAPAAIAQGDTRYNAGFNAHYEVSKELDVYSSFMFDDDHNHTVSSPVAVFEGSGTVAASPFGGAVLNPGYVETNCSNPLMTASENAALCGGLTPNAQAIDPATGLPTTLLKLYGPSGPFGHGYDNLLGNGRYDGAGNYGSTCGVANTPTCGQSLLYIGRRGVEVGGRVTDTNRDAYRIVIGGKGDLGDGWSYDVFAQYGRTVFQQELSGDWSKQRVQSALEVNPTTGACVDTSASGCVPLDIFNGLGSLSSASGKAGLNYITIDDLQEGFTEEDVMGGNITGDLGQWGGQSPWAKNPISVVFGTEWRQETLKFQVDTTNSSGDTYGGAETQSTPQSAYDVTEGYTEIKIPLVQDMPWVEDFTAHGAYRYSSYSTVGAVHSYSADLTYQPIDDFRVRAAYQRATRAPNVLEFFKPQNTQLFSGTDPCATSTAGQCAGVPNAGTGPNGILACPAGQCNEQVGGDPTLKPEISDTRTIGVVLTPTFLDGFSATIDYYSISVSNYIGAYGSQVVLDGCYGGTATPATEALFCPLVHRSGSGGIYGGPGNYVKDISVNLPYIKTKGVDFEANYTTSFDDWGVEALQGYGGVSARFLGTWLNQWSESPEAVSVPNYFNCAGKYGAICGSTQGTGGVLPRWRHSLRLTWTTPWDVDFSLNWRHISAVGLDLNSTNPLLNSVLTGYCASYGISPCKDTADAQIKSFDYFDVAVDWTVREGVELRAGVNNIFALNPPAVSASSPNVSPQPFGSSNTYPGIYDILGREIFVGATIKY